MLMHVTFIQDVIGVRVDDICRNSYNYYIPVCDIQEILDYVCCIDHVNRKVYLDLFAVLLFDCTCVLGEINLYINTTLDCNIPNCTTTDCIRSYILDPIGTSFHIPDFIHILPW